MRDETGATVQGLGGPGRPESGGRAEPAVVDVSPAGLRARFAAVREPHHPLALAVSLADDAELRRASDELGGDDGVVLGYHLLVVLAAYAELAPTYLATLDVEELVPSRWPARPHRDVFDASPAGVRHWLVDLIPAVVPAAAGLAAMVAAAPPDRLRAVSAFLLAPTATGLVALDPTLTGPPPGLQVSVHPEIVLTCARVLGVDLHAADVDLAGLTPAGARPEDWLEAASAGRWRLLGADDPDPDLDPLQGPFLGAGPAQRDDLRLPGVSFGPVHGFSFPVLARRLVTVVAVLAVCAVGWNVLRDSGTFGRALAGRPVAFDGHLSTEPPPPGRSFALDAPARVPTEQAVARLLGATRLAGRYLDSPVDSRPGPQDAYVSLDRAPDRLRVLAERGRVTAADGGASYGLPADQAVARTRVLLAALGADLSQVRLEPRTYGQDSIALAVEVQPALDGTVGANASLALGGDVELDRQGPVEVDLAIARLRPLPPAPLDPAATAWRAFAQHLDPQQPGHRTYHYTDARLVYATVTVPPSAGGDVELHRLAPAWEFSRPDPDSTTRGPDSAISVDVAADPAERNGTFYAR